MDNFNIYLPLKNFSKIFLFLIPAIIIFAVLCYQLNFTQDDAFISYRYAANYLNGDGLVYNIGERVEGFTNFGWVIYLIFSGTLGFDYIFVSKLTGILFGIGIIILTFLIAVSLLNGKNKWFALLPVYLVGINQSLAYWSISGLETSAFAFCSMLCFYYYLKRSWLLSGGLIIAVLLRPEGALVAGLLIIIETLETKRVPMFTFRCAVMALLPLIPYIYFKITYYGSILPNPFYAKTGFDLKQLTNGLEYTERFFSHYGFYGIGFFIPLFFIKKLNAPAKSIILFAGMYILYIILIGGDVLKVHRFFLPVMGLSAILISLSGWLLVKRFNKNTRLLILFLSSIVLISLTYTLPKKFVSNYNKLEKLFTRKMRFTATALKKADSTSFSVALPTIGIFGYELIGHEIIDMVGLTDTTIARYSEKPIKGMQTTWKEQKHNTKYLLNRAPSYILFSTGVKPSAPAERALMLFSQFLEAYGTIGWFYQVDKNDPRGTVQTIFKKVKEIRGKPEPNYPVEFVENYKLGLDAYAAGNQNKAIEFYNRAIYVSPEPVYINLLYQKAFSLFLIREYDKARLLMDSVILRDSTVFMAHKELYMMAIVMKDTTKAKIHKKWLQKLVPWYWPRIEAQVAAMFK